MGYSSEQYGRAVELRNAGRSLADIEAETGVRKASCLWYFRRIGLRLPPEAVARLRGKVPDEVRHEVLRRRAAGEAAEIIARDLGLQVNTVYKLCYAANVRLTRDQIWKNNHGLRRPRHDYPPLVRERNAGATIAELSDRTGIPELTLEKELPRRGARVGPPRRTWQEFRQGLAKFGMSAIDAPVDGLMTKLTVRVRCFVVEILTYRT